MESRAMDIILNFLEEQQDKSLIDWISIRGRYPGLSDPPPPELSELKSFWSFYNDEVSSSSKFMSKVPTHHH